MKKTIVFAVLLVAVAAASAHAQTMRPYTDRAYECTYTHPTMSELSPGYSRFHPFTVYNTELGPMLRGVESFIATYGSDQRKVTFAKGFDIIHIGINGEERLLGTRWEFTINPNGPQCTSAIVRNWGKTISFQGCSDGHSRFCTTDFP